MKIAIPIKVNHIHAWRSGFSLLELLVVISIIGILLSIGAVSYTSAQKKARDSRRIQDMKAIQSAEEQYFSVNGAYIGIGLNGAACSGSIPGIMDSVPVDPKDSSHYRCWLGIGDGYCSDALLESTTGNCGGCSTGGGSTYYAFASGTTRYCVRNLQSP